MNIKELKRGPASTDFIGARVSSELKDWLIAYCTREGVTVSRLLMALLSDYRAQVGEEPKESLKQVTERRVFKQRRRKQQ